MRVMRHNWHHLLFMHWPISAAEVAPLLPEGLTLDLHQGQAYVGLVAFTMSDVGPWRMRFPEVNVRTCVRGPDGESGVHFFSLDASRRLAVWAARLCYGLPYHRAKMNVAFEGQSPLVVNYSSARRWRGEPATCHLRYGPEGSAAPAEEGSLEHFLVERYSLYAVKRRRLVRARVRHAPYPLQSARVYSWQESLLLARRIIRPSLPPLCHYSAGVAVELSSAEPL